jgi:HEAT repeat protein
MPSLRHLVKPVLIALFLPIPCFPQSTDHEKHSTATKEDTKAAASQVTAKSSQARAWEILERGMAEKSMHDRLMAVAALGNIGSNAQAIKLAETALNDREPEVRQAGAEVLGRMKARSAIPKLRATLDDPSPEVGLAAAEALWCIGDRSVRNLLVDVLAGDRPASEGFIKKQMRDARRKLHDPKGLAIIGAKEGAGDLLGPMGFVVPMAKGFVGDKGISPRAATATLLATDHDPKSVKALEAALGDKDWSVRAASAKALGEIRRSEFVSALEPLLLDDKPEVRYAAAASIIRIKSKKREEYRHPSEPESARIESGVPAH